MDDVKLKLAGTVAGKLSAAPASAAKDELVEELSDNLYRRFLDMTGAGVPEDEAFRRALDDLGDVDELLAYLGVEPAGDVTIDQREGQIRVTSSSGKTVVINNPGEGEPIIINGKPIETGPAPEEKGPQGQGDQQGGAHCDYSGGQTSSSELNAILTSVSEACNTAIDQARDALKLARDAIKRRTIVEKDKGRVKVHFNTSPGLPRPRRTPPVTRLPRLRPRTAPAGSLRRSWTPTRAGSSPGRDPKSVRTWCTALATTRTGAAFSPSGASTRREAGRPAAPISAGRTHL